MFDRKPSADVRRGHPAAEDTWPPKPIDRSGGTPAAGVHPIDRHLEYHDKRVMWVWRLGGVVLACVVFGWAGHATVSAWSTRWQTTEGAEQDRDRIRKLEAAREQDQLKLHDLERDTQELRRELDDVRQRLDARPQHRLP
jgi:hypothetical protein